MVASKASTPAKPITLTDPKKTIAAMTASSDAVGLETRIRDRAYQLYEGRGREDGQDKQDWVRAEGEIVNRRP